MSKAEKLLQHVFRLFDPRVRIDASRVPFTVGCVDVNHGDGFDMLRICAADPDDRKPVVMFRLDNDALDGKELSLNVI